ncbi:hypothetical protein NGC32_08490 [Kluyvera cryocrescens]|uniref:hypothetical protein n=1 Tax=Kluyvera cryocrescens TaxID=580 RepID=UPI002DC04903|nr:hypothetical protein [Kluyvera cryocrescens]MEB7712766.1 hypothetical protein [Kluyvera cryocrescens]
MKAYATKNNLKVTERTLSIFKRYIFSIPFDEDVDQRSKPYFYKSIASFLEHLICSATVSRGTKKKADFEGDDEWTYSIPFPYDLGRDIAPAVFKRSRELHFTRALELLEYHKIIKIIRHNAAKRKCRRFCFSQEFLSNLFECSRESYLSRQDRYYRLSDIYMKGCSWTIDELISVSLRDNGVVKNKVSCRDIPENEFRSLVKNVYNNLSSLMINIDAMMTYCNENPSAINCSYFYNFISHISNIESEVKSLNPLVISYMQSYKTASKGSRSFEVGTGFQYLPSKMKWSSLAKGFNYDIKSCQLQILKNEFRRNGITRRNLGLLSTENICRDLKIDDKHVKTYRFAAIFNLGVVNCSPKSNMMKSLTKLLGPCKSRRLLERWNERLSPLRSNMNELVDIYARSGRNTKHGYFVENAVGQKFNCGVPNDKFGLTNANKRKLLAHMIQGIESKAVYDFVLNNEGVCALEHDGFVSLNELSDDAWTHPYLKIVKK